MIASKIEWTDSTWSPWRGCTKVSPGCAHCYAETLSKRNPAVLGQWGKGKPRVLAKNWRDPVKWDRARAEESMRENRCVPKPTVFPSLCDWLDDEVPVEWLAQFLKLIHDTPNLTWLLLTKRPENWTDRIMAVLNAIPDNQDEESLPEWIDWVQDWVCSDTPPANVWVGTSVEDQIRADKRIPALLRIPAVGRFLSVEPLLGPVDDIEWAFPQIDPVLMATMVTKPKEGVNWVIIGGESGHGARPCNIDWIRSLVRQCASGAVPCFVKQVGARPVESIQDCRGGDLGFRRVDGITHPKGGDPAEWPEDLRVREFPEGMR